MEKGLASKMKSLYPFIKHFSAAQEGLFLAELINRRYPPGKVLTEEGFICSSIFFILEGSVRVFKISEDGREVTLYRIRKGDLCLMTAHCILAGSEFPAISQVETETEVAALPAHIFKELLEKTPQLQSFIFASSLDRLKDVVAVVESITFTGMKQRLAKFLLTQARQQSSQTLRITHEEMAIEIGTAREVVTRTLGERLGRGRVQILSMESLQQICFCD